MTTNLALASIKATGASTSGTFADRFGDTHINVKRDFGAVGNGSADDTTAIQNALDAAFGTSGAPHGSSNPTSNRAVYFPPGDYKITSPLTITDVLGGYIYGAGRFTTKIRNATANSSVLVANGMAYSVVERIMFECSSTATTSCCFDLDWDGTGQSIQSNTFQDIEFSHGSYGLRIGHSGNMGSETSIINCFFDSNNVAGLKTENQNALQQTVMGGNFQSCAIGIFSNGGAVPVIHGVGFQLQSDYDIKIIGTVGDAAAVIACRSESPNFLSLQTGAAAHVAGCNHISAGGAGTFVTVEGSKYYAGSAVIDNCYSSAGVVASNGLITLRGSYIATLAGITATRFVDIFQSHIGGSIGREVIRQRITTAGTRTYDVEAAALTDTSFLWDGVAEDVTVTDATNTITVGLANSVGHGLTVDTPVFFGSTANGLSAGTVYYVIASGLTAADFKVSTSVGGSAVNITSDGTNTCAIGRTYAVGDQVLKSNVAAGGSPGWICTTAGVATVATFKALASVAA